ncbi:MAG TPA: hypothetical protein VFP25_04120 [Nitrososphaeraceae archaeon]|nr:hypothetical protein [Nitrososphaeraceae archaeon]
MQKNNLQEWKDGLSDGEMNSKISISCIKRMFGEYVTVIRFENTIKDIILKVSLYNLPQNITVTLLLVGYI